MMRSEKNLPSNHQENPARDALYQALDQEFCDKIKGFLAGVKAWNEHPRLKTVNEHVCVWQAGNTRLYHVNPNQQPYNNYSSPPVFLVPSLVNRGTILDLAPDFSLARSLARNGLNVFLLDWQEPNETERTFNPEDYILHRLSPALNAIAKLTEQKTCSVAGYCLGGTLAAGLATRHPGQVDKLVMIATPWAMSDNFRAFTDSSPWLKSVMKDGVLPAYVLQTLFALMQPGRVLDKFARFAEFEPNSAAAKRFVEVEDWLNDGIPLAAPVAETCFNDWWLNDSLLKGEWKVDDKVVQPSMLPCARRVVIALRDQLVPPESSLPLAHDASEIKYYDTGHIGLMAGSQAPVIWQEIIDFLMSC